MSDAKQKAADAKARGNAAFSKGEFDKAVEEFTAAIALDPTDHIFFSNRSGAYASLKNWEKALEDANACLERKRDFAKGYSRKASALQALGRWEESKTVCEEGLKIEPNNEALKQSLEDFKQRNKKPDPLASMNKMFGPDMWPKLHANPVTREFLKDEAYVNKLKQLQNNPSAFTQLMAGDQRMQQTLGVILGIGVEFGAGPSPAEAGAGADKSDRKKDSASSSSSSPSAAPKTASVSTSGGATVMDETEDPEEEDVEIEGDSAKHVQKSQPPVKEKPKEQPKETVKPKETPKESRQAASAETPAKREAEEEKNKGSELYKKRQFDEALVHYKKSLDLDPDNITSYTNLAAVHMEKKEFEQAIELCRKGIDVGQAHNAGFKLVAKAYVRIGNAYMKMDKLEEALEAYRKAQVEDYQEDTKKLIKKAEDIKKQRDAAAYVDPAKSNEHKEAGNKLFAENKFVEAITEYTEALKRDPNNYKVLSNRAACYSKLMDWSRALEDCDACIAKDPSFVKAYIRKGKVQHFLKQYHKALETYEAGLKIDPNASELLEGRRATILSVNQENQSGNVDPQRAKEAMKDPAIQAILRDPTVATALQRLQEDPKAAQHILMDPVMGPKIQKLVVAGVLQMR